MSESRLIILKLIKKKKKESSLYPDFPIKTGPFSNQIGHQGSNAL
jgi:hypothetical protein